MPGVVMENAGIVGAEQGVGARHGTSTSPGGTNQGSMPVGLNKSPAYTNGVSEGTDYGIREQKAPSTKLALRVNDQVPELPHITQGFFPFSTLVNRSVQQCWNDLSDLVTELAEIQIPSHDVSSISMPANGKISGNQSSENIQKKVRVLEFAHAKRAEFIKLLVLSQWSRQAADVSKLIDIQNFIRTRHQSYVSALQWIGDLKRNLVQAQVANPDLKTALEVLSKARIVSMPDPGYKPPRPLTAKRTLKKLKKIDRILSARLLCDIVPRSFETYHIHDGRVTFIVPGEFELDLSIGEADESSQFYFVDIRFLFHPSASVPQGRMFNDLESTINDTLRNNGLTGCFDLVHNLVLTNKINILFKQAVELSRGLWSNVLRIELLHRTLIVHYWALKPGAKSWLEIGVKRGHQGLGHNHGAPFLGLRWLRDGQEIDWADVEFDVVNLSMESALRSVIALHTSHILLAAHNLLSQNFLFAAGKLNLQAQLTGIEPGDCQLDVQLTPSRHLRVSIEPMSGAVVLSARPSALERPESERTPEKTSAEDIVSRVSRLRCIAAIEEIETHVKMLGFEPVNPKGLKIDVRRVFPSNVIRFSFFWHTYWDRDWIVAATSSMDGDKWWVIQLLPPTSTGEHPMHDTGTLDQSMPRTAQIVSSTLFPLQEQISYASFADIGHCLSGILAIYANARSMADLQTFSFYPSMEKLALGSGFQVPAVFIRYNPASLPSSFQRFLPGGSKAKGLIKDTIRLAFHGVEPHSKVAIIVAYGSLLVPAKAFSSLSAKWDRSLVFSKRGHGFAIRLLAPPGRPVIISLMENLQRLECVLSIFETLQRKRMAPQSLSLSQIAFAYGPQRSLFSHIDIETLSRTKADTVGLSSHTHHMSHLRLNISFGCSNPHRRIQGPLTSILNHSSTMASIDSVTELLSLTLPLMQAFDQIMTNQSHKEHLRMQVIVRSAKAFIIHYPNQNLRFQLKASFNKPQMVWIVSDQSCVQGPLANKQLDSDFKTKLFEAKGNGWKGLGSGIVADAEEIGNFILELDRWIISGRNDLTSQDPHVQAKATGSGDLTQPQAREQAVSKSTGNGPATKATFATRMNNNNAPPEADAASGSLNADIIMID